MRIVEYDSLRGLVAAIAIKEQAELDLGGLNGDEQGELDPRTPWLSATVLTNGNIVVNEATQHKFFSPRGAFVRAVGRKGQGPGEFSQTREVCLVRGDTLLVIDYGDGRLSLWDSAGRHVRTFTRPGLIPFGGCSADGTVIVRDPTAKPIVDTSGQPSFEYDRVRPDGSSIGRVGLLPAPEYAGPIWREPSIIARDSTLYVGDGREFEVRVYHTSGKLDRVLRVNEPPPALTEERWQQDLRLMVPMNVTGEQRAALLARLGNFKRPKSYPAFRRLRVDDSQRMWIQDYVKPHMWTVFDSTGAFLAQLEVPFGGSARADLVGVFADRVVILRREGHGAPHLSFHLVVSATGAPRQ